MENIGEVGGYENKAQRSLQKKLFKNENYDSCKVWEGWMEQRNYIFLIPSILCTEWNLYWIIGAGFSSNDSGS